MWLVSLEALIDGLLYLGAAPGFVRRHSWACPRGASNLPEGENRATTVQRVDT